MNINLDVALIVRNDTEENWNNKNPILLNGEQGIVTNGNHKGMSKTGDGLTDWNSLDWDKSIANGGNADTVGGKTIPDNIASFNRYTTTLLASGWEGITTTDGDFPPYTQTLTISGITSDDYPVVDIIISGESVAESMKNAWNNVDKISTGNNSITAYCYSQKPESDIPIQLLVTKG